MCDVNRNKMLFFFSLLFSISLILWGVSNPFLQLDRETIYNKLDDIKIYNDVMQVYEKYGDTSTELVVILPNNSTTNIVGAKDYFETYVNDQVLLTRDDETYHQFNLVLLDQNENVIESCVYTDEQTVVTVSKTKKPFIKFKY